MRFQEILIETGNEPADFHIESSTGNKWTVVAPELKLVLELHRLQPAGMDDMVSIVFSVNDRIDTTNTGNVVKILSTVKAMLERTIHSFIKLNDKRVVFSSMKNESSRVKLYDRIVPKISDILGNGWQYDDRNDENHPVKYYNWVRRSPLRETPVLSAWISDLTYNRPNKILTMRLSNGNTYSIPDISRTIFDQWKKAPSKGTFFHNQIKDKHEVVKI